LSFRVIDATVLSAAAALVAFGCVRPLDPGPPGEGLSPSAKPEIVEVLRADLAAERDPADGGGRAWLDIDASSGSPGRAGEPGHWVIIYEAGPRGVAEGGVVFLQVSPFWDWSMPHDIDPSWPGFTEVTTDAEGVELTTAGLAQQKLGIRIGGRELRQGERLRIDYGAGPAGAVADRFAEHESRFWIWVDADGDGISGLLADSPAVDVRAGPAERLLLTLPATARRGERVRLTLAVLDRDGNAGVDFEGSIRLRGARPGLGLPAEITLAAAEQGLATLELTALDEGTITVEADGPRGLRAESNPLVVAADLPRVLWGDLHGHSGLSDGTGTPADYFLYARDVAALDVVALTDHDHWGMQPLSGHPELWARVRAQVGRFHEPGRFVTLLGYEWTSWLHGHRHVLYFGDDGEVLSSVDPRYEQPTQLWEALRNRDALTFAHHSAGGPVATNWDFAPDPELEPVTEIASVHGSSEAADAPGPIYSAVDDNWVRDALDRGYRLGFVGSGDGHDGHPGASHLASTHGGLAAILADEPTRAAVKEALLSRRVYATNGPRILLLSRLDDLPMGAELAPAESATLDIRVVAPGALATVDVVRSGVVVERIPGDGEREIRLRRTLESLVSGEYVYVRAVQVDGGAAWSSPFFIR